MKKSNSTIRPSPLGKAWLMMNEPRSPWPLIFLVSAMYPIRFEVRRNAPEPFRSPVEDSPLRPGAQPGTFVAVNWFVPTVFVRSWLAVRQTL